MERREMVFEIDEKKIAEMVMEKRLETVNKRREIMNEVRRDLGRILNCKVLWSYADDYLQFNIYNEEKQNDYKIIIVKRFENEEELSEKTLCSINMLYVREVYKKYTCEDYEIHKASILENVVVDLIDKNQSNNLYVLDGRLCTSNQDFEWKLEDIKEFHVYDDEDSLIKFYDTYDECEYIISFMHDEVIELN